MSGLELSLVGIMVLNLFLLGYNNYKAGERRWAWFYFGATILGVGVVIALAINPSL